MVQAARSRFAWFTAAVLAASVGLGSVSSAVAQPTEMPPRPRLPGYLGPEGVPDHLVFLPPPPTQDSPVGAADLEVFRVTRALEGSPRWQLAASDAEAGGNKMLEHFACALGAELTLQDAPALGRLIARASADLGPMIGASKDHYKRPRPFLVEEGPVCVQYSESFAASGSYPSGHAAAGWLHALLFAAVDSDNTAEILARGRSYGESRVVCGVHYLTDVEGGRAIATALVAALQSNAEFRADLEAARKELTALRAKAAEPDAQSCALEAAALPTPW